MPSSGRSLYEQVYAMVRSVPWGRVTTYGAIARALGTPSHGREVGWALASLSDSDHDVPAHRVVNVEGALSGGAAFGGAHIQRALLEAEGVCFDDRQRVVLARYLWHPEPVEWRGT